MDWTRAIDGYCERTNSSFWSEPVNALTSLAFIVMALVMLRRSSGRVGGQVLSGLLFLIGTGSWLFHTHAAAWAGVADMVPITIFTLVYIYLANRNFLGFPVWVATLGAAAYIPYTIALTPIFGALPFLSISSFYWPLPVLIFAYAFLLRRRSPETAKGLALGAALLCVSLTARSLDMPLCDALPLGTHWVWHCLNALMLAWMIEVWRRHPATS